MYYSTQRLFFQRHITVLGQRLKHARTYASPDTYVAHSTIYGTLHMFEGNSNHTYMYMNLYIDEEINVRLLHVMKDAFSELATTSRCKPQNC